MNNFVIILVEPKQPGNIGSVCRAMANFGVAELRLVNPVCDHLAEEATRLAVFAAPLLDAAAICPTLGDAIADCHYTIAATRRAGCCRNALQSLPVTAAAFVGKSARIGLVFGREQSGLTTQEVVMCSHAAAIETTVDGSLNLAQAVVVFLYELTRQRLGSAVAATEAVPPLQEDYERLFTTMAEVLDRTAYLNRQRPEALMNPLRRIHQRARLSVDELDLLRGIWSRLEESVHDWPGKRRGK
ncbi:MAG: RNA methyltransferase [Desulfuromonadaceae bacterium]|nr:RNA methyltransferase [Desulfuromonadaceae bacterium]